jgi:hypothetical protein
VNADVKKLQNAKHTLLLLGLLYILSVLHLNRECHQLVAKHLSIARSPAMPLSPVAALPILMHIHQNQSYQYEYGPYDAAPENQLRQYEYGPYEAAPGYSSTQYDHHVPYNYPAPEYYYSP